MAGEGGGGEPSSRIVVGWGIYDRLKKVPRLASATKDVTSPRGRKMDLSETASETAARRMVEDLFKQEADAAEPLGYFALIDHNEITHRKPRKQEEDEITVCECVIEEDNPESACGDQCLNMMTYTECTPGYCHSGELCRNQRFQKCQYAQTKLVKTDNRGWGLAAAQDLKAGDFVIEYCGEVVPVKEALHRAKVYETAGAMINWYIINMNGGEYIDATHSGNLARFINHSCEPNCETAKWSVLGEERIGIFAIQDISAGTELTYDYKSTWFGGARMRCFCGASSCAGYFGCKSKAFQVYMKDGAPFGKDAYAWEDDAQMTDAEEGRQSDAEDDAPLSSIIDQSLVGRKVRSGMIINSKHAGIIIKTTAEKSSGAGAADASVKKETQVSAETPTSVSGPSYAPAEKSTPVRRRASVLKKDKLSSFKGVHVHGGKFKDTTEPKVKKTVKGVRKFTKSEEQEEKEEQEFMPSRKKIQSDTQDQLKGDVSEYVARIAAGFQRARTAVNNMLLEEFPSCFPVSEAACAEVEFAKELEIAAESDLKKVFEEIQPAVREYHTRDGDDSYPMKIVGDKFDKPSPMNVAEKWMEAHCKHLRSKLDFNFSVIRQLAGPTFVLCSIKEVPSS